MVVIAIALNLAGCTTLSPLRQNSVAKPYNSLVVGDDQKLAFIEFGEHGSYQDPSQLQNALRLIRGTDRPLVITYIHGWQNNAQSDDVKRFSSLLSRLHRAPAIRNAGFNVVGVYLAWRGRLTSVPVLKELSFWSRKATAERIASNFDCYDAIASISEAARKYHSNQQYTILLGHSFGGLIVERAVAHAINAEMHGRATPERSLPADLMLVVNPASDSILSRQMIAALYNRRTEHTRPLFISITSSADRATGLAFPLGTEAAALTKAFNSVAVPGPYRRTETERAFFTSTPGHNRLLLNHVTERLPNTINSRGVPALETNLQHNLIADVFTVDGPGGILELWKFRLIGDVDVPYWNIQVDPSIIRDHGDLWNERAEAMMAALFRIGNPKLSHSQLQRPVLYKQPDPVRSY